MFVHRHSLKSHLFCRARFVAGFVLAAAIAGAVSDNRIWAQPPSFDRAAAIAQNSVVTVRIVLPVEAKEEDPLAEPQEPHNRVRLCTGLAVGTRWIITSAYASSDATIGITTSTGQRDKARLRVLDEYSGLMLLETQKLKLKPFSMAPAGQQQVDANEASDLKPSGDLKRAGGRKPNEPKSNDEPNDELKPGEWVLGAAGWGASPPVISFGVVSAVDREQPGYPPLLQLDARTVDTSSGAAVLDPSGRLRGVVVAVDKVQPQGWTYAVPTSHVQRMLRLWKQANSKQPQATASPGRREDNDKVIILRRRRPEAGMELRGAEAGGVSVVVVQRVRENGPAQRAGVKVGDEVLSVDGVQIRSVYEAVRPILSRQPGDTLIFRIRNEQGTQDVELVLAGGVLLPRASLKTVSNLVQPKLFIEGLPGGIRKETTDRARPLLNTDEQDEPSRADKLDILEKAVNRYQRVIDLQRKEMLDLMEQRQQDQKKLEALEKQIAELKNR